LGVRPGGKASLIWVGWASVVERAGATDLGFS
jgi:hypothetical protein